MTRIAYFVHDVNDPAVARRVAMFHAAGATPVVVGFRRDERSPADIDGAPVVVIGQTRDAAMLQRAGAVIGNRLRPGAMLAAAKGADIIIGRNLESLALAARARKATPGAKLIYECLDIHRTLLGKRLPHRLIQRVEAALLRGVELLIVSSPAFTRDYFAKRPTLAAPVLLLENKLLLLDRDPPHPAVAPAGPPWTIGWFGNLRCARTFDLLRALAFAMDGRVRVLIAGRPSLAVFTGFEQQVAAAPHVEFYGSYRAEDLATLYARCHFAWSIDYFEEGQNSTWLLPNRLYEATAFGAVPIALRTVETGQWLAARAAGVVLDDDPVAGLQALLGTLDDDGYAQLRGAVAAIPRHDVIADRDDCVAMMQTVIQR